MTRIKIAVLALAAISGLTSVLPAQTLFHQPDTAPDYSHYKYAEECLIAIRRIADSVKNTVPVWSDTVAYKKESLLASNSTKSIETGTQCLNKFSADSISRDDAKYWSEVFLLADMDEKVDSVYLRIYDSIFALSGRQRDSLLYMTFSEHLQVFRNARPVRFAKIKELYDMSKAQIPADSFLLRMGLPSLIRMAADDIGDDSTARLMAREVMILNDSLPEDQRNSPMYKGFFIEMISRALNQLYADSLLTVLSVDTDAYLSLRKKLWDSAGGDNASFDRFNGPLGEVAPPLVADHWYKRDSAVSSGYTNIPAATIPVSGRINLLVPMHGGCHNEAVTTLGATRKNPSGGCWPSYATLRRIKKEFPQVEITFLVNTHGNIGRAAPLNPAVEADTLADFFLGFHKVPGSLAVVERDYFKLPGLDRRRIDTPTENENNYTLGAQGSVLHYGSVLVIDENGKLVHIMQNLREANQIKLYEFVKVLVNRVR